MNISSIECVSESFVMKLWFIKFSLFIGSFFFIISCGKSSKPGPYFWQVQKDGRVSYFLGTYHVGVTLENLQCSEQIKMYLKQSDFLFTEVADSNSKSDQKFNRILQEYKRTVMSSKENGQEFQSLNTDSQIFFRSRNISENLSYIGYIIVLDNLCRDQAFYATGAGTVSLDAQFKAISQSENMQVGYLDANEDTDAVAEAYIGIRYSHWENVNNEDVNEAVSGFESCIFNTVNRINKYIEGDLTIFNSKEYDRVLLRDRNVQWVAKFKEVHGSGRYDQIFLAGGTAHFIANFNVLDMLRKDGFSISRMNSDCEY